LQESVYDHQEVKKHIWFISEDDIKDKLANNELKVCVGIYNPGEKSYLFKLSRGEFRKFSTEELYRLLPRDSTKQSLETSAQSIYTSYLKKSTRTIGVCRLSKKNYAKYEVE
jgi:hypothetical protein